MQSLSWSIRFLFLAAALGAQCAGAENVPLGPFEGHADIGSPKLSGSATFDDKRFTIKAAGANMMDAHDEFHFVWRRMKGDFVLSARVLFTGPGVAAHRKAGLMARAGLGDAAAYVDATVHGEGPKAVQVRRSDSGPTEMIVMAGPGKPPAADPSAPSAGMTPTPKLLRLERHGQRFTMSIREEGKPDVLRELSDASLPDTLYVGLFLCAHNPDVVETGVFDQVGLGPGE